MPLSIVESAEWRRFVSRWVTNVPQPTISAKTLTTRVLRTAVEEYRSKIMLETIGKDVTLQADGWTGVNNHHLIAFMITYDLKSVSGMEFNILILYSSFMQPTPWQVHTIDLYDSTAE